MRRSITSEFNNSRIGSVRINEGSTNGIFYIKQKPKPDTSYSNKAFLEDINDELNEELNLNKKSNINAQTTKTNKNVENSELPPRTLRKSQVYKLIF